MNLTEHLNSKWNPDYEQMGKAYLEYLEYLEADRDRKMFEWERRKERAEELVAEVEDDDQ